MKFYKRVNSICSFVVYIMFILTFVLAVLCTASYGYIQNYINDNIIETTTSFESLVEALSAAAFLIVSIIFWVSTVLFLIASVFSFKYNRKYKRSSDLVFIRKSLTAKGIVFILIVFSRLFTLLNSIFSTMVFKYDIGWILDISTVVLIVLTFVARFKLANDLKKGKLVCVDGDVITDN